MSNPNPRPFPNPGKHDHSTYKHGPPKKSELDEVDKLILQELADGKTWKHIARTVHISERSCHQRKNRFLPLLEAANLHNAIAIAIRNGIID